jgi:methylated-DNA-[protein]-cysteine S-methyltransferase
MLHRTVIDTPIGPLTLVASAAGLRAVSWGHSGDPGHRSPGADTVDDPSHPVLVAAARQLGEYFSGARRDFDLPLDLHGTPFQRAAWSVLRTIPYGTTISYGEQAGRLGDRRKARAVGAANGRNPVPIVVPCHRVVGADGALTGFAAGTDVKAWLLDHERRVLALAG